MGHEFANLVRRIVYGRRSPTKSLILAISIGALAAVTSTVTIAIMTARYEGELTPSAFWDARPISIRDHAFGVTRTVVTHIDQSEQPARILRALSKMIGVQSYTIDEMMKQHVSVGFPWPCMQYDVWFGFVRNDANRTDNHEFMCVTRGLIMPAARPLPHMAPVVAPVSFVWGGLLGNALLFALVWETLLRLPGAIRRLHRSRKNRCLACGYDLQQIQVQVCPECGDAPQVLAASPRPSQRSQEQSTCTARRGYRKTHAFRATAIGCSAGMVINILLVVTSPERFLFLPYLPPAGPGEVTERLFAAARSTTRIDNLDQDKLERTPLTGPEGPPSRSVQMETSHKARYEVGWPFAWVHGDVLYAMRDNSGMERVSTILTSPTILELNDCTMLGQDSEAVRWDWESPQVLPFGINVAGLLANCAAFVGIALLGGLLWSGLGRLMNRRFTSRL